MIGFVRRIVIAVKARANGQSAAVELLPPMSATCKTKSISAGYFGLIAAALIGITAGVVGAKLSGRMIDARAEYASTLDLRDAPLTGAAGARSVIIAKIAESGIAERLDPPKLVAPKPGGSRPRLIIIFDDMGLDRRAFDEVMALPGPVTMSFLPYARDIQPLIDRASARGDDILLHMPMEPSGNADPGPHSLSGTMKSERLFDELAWNLSQFSGYVGVNNHMGSKLTRDSQAMKRVLAMLDQRGLFFVDSLTTSGSVATAAGDAVGADVYVRDVFLDPEPGRPIIQRQLALAENIAAKTGYAVVICHPRRDTLDVIGPWLTTAPARGFDLATVSSLQAMNKFAARAAP
jgi:polysaccharide deacetylase 2 family uncharacterized protein YibQ